VKYKHCAECGCRIDWRKVRCCRHQVETGECDVLKIDVDEVRS